MSSELSITASTSASALCRDIFGSSDPIVKIMPSLKVFNLPLFEVYLVIDCRPADAYSQSHIQSAFNFPPCAAGASKEEKMAALTTFVRFMTNHYVNEIWSSVIVYGSNSGDQIAANHLTEFVAQLKQFIVTKSGMITRSDSSELESCNLIDHIANRTNEIWVVDGDFETFRREYPVLCHPSNSENTSLSGAAEMIPLPYHISEEGDGVFIGSRAVKWTASLLKEFRIKALIIDDRSFGPLFDDIKLNELEIESFLCSVPDHGDTGRWSTDQMHLLFDNATDFIQNCIISNRRVVINIHGRSLSSAIAIAWFMKYHSMNFHEAKAMVISLAPKNCSSLTSVLDESLLCESDLLSYNKRRRIEAS
jgi:hypothetical protein